MLEVLDLLVLLFVLVAARGTMGRQPDEHGQDT